ncbi:hypothetical protein ACX12M_07415 [Cellulosimicrobium cellulans]
MPKTSSLSRRMLVDRGRTWVLVARFGMRYAPREKFHFFQGAGVNSRAIRVVMVIGMACALALVPAGANAASKGGVGDYCNTNYRVMVQSLTLGDTTHEVNSAIWHKGWKNWVTSTTYSTATGTFSWHVKAREVNGPRTNANCTLR